MPQIAFARLPNLGEEAQAADLYGRMNGILLPNIPCYHWNQQQQ